MCGIVGIVDFTIGSVEQRELLSLRDALCHRGPDDAGVYVDRKVGLGHRRLAIIDLSPLGHQPMSNEDDTIWVVFNGEIYNYREVREILLERGHRFRSRSDTEVIVQAYEEWGDDCVQRLIGMFAFAIYDKRPEAGDGRLLLARDRLGVKPLFYTQQGSRLIFASEVHALYRYVSPSWANLDRDVLDYYLAFGYVPSDRCLVQGVHKLPPAHILVYDSHGLHTRRYWQVTFRPTQQTSLQDCLDELDEHLRRAVVRRLESDVPLGCFLSGGIDSGLVTALAAQASAQPLRTFTVSFTGSAPHEDERSLAQAVAQRYSTRHQELVVDPADRTLLPRLLWHYGEPFADISALPVFQISQKARQHITVALSGDGGDESFAGYVNVHSAYLAEEARRYLPSPALCATSTVANYFGHWLPLARRVGSWLDHYVAQPVLDHYDLRNHWDRGRRLALYHPEWLNGRQPDLGRRLVADVQARAPQLSDPEMHLYTDLHLRLPGDYLTKVDIASSLVALEVRSPFLDHELVEFAARLPFKYKLLNGQQKGLLRCLATRYLPTELVRAPKRGFGPPLGEWLRKDWAPMVQRLLVDGLARRPRLFQPQVIQQTVRAHLTGNADHSQRLWNLVCLEIWWRLFVEQSLRPGDTL